MRPSLTEQSGQREVERNGIIIDNSDEINTKSWLGKES